MRGRAAALLLACSACAESPPQPVLPLLTAPALTPTASAADASTPSAPPAGVIVYPEALWDARVEGRVMLQVFLGADATLDSVRLEQGSGYPAMDSAALAGAPGRRYARVAGEPRAGWYRLPVEFSLSPPYPPPDEAAR